MSHKEIEKEVYGAFRLLRRNFRFMNMFSKKKKVKKEGGGKSGSGKKTASPTRKPKEKTSSTKVQNSMGTAV